LTEDYFIKSGEFIFDGLTLEELLRDRKTPLYAYSADVIRQKYQKLKSNFPNFDIFYSFKPNPNPGVAAILRNEGAHAEVSSAGELRSALKAGFKPESIIFVAPAKTEGEIELAVREGIYALVSDSRYEIELIDKIALEQGKYIRVLLRINTLEGPSTATEKMVGGPGKFGFDEEQVLSELSGLSPKAVRISGIQVYAASQVMDAVALALHIENVVGLALRIKESLGIEIEAVDFGGGFGVPYGSEPELNLSLIAETAAELFEKHKDELPGCRFILEIGRYLVAECGIFITKVLRIKESRGTGFVVCDGGMNCFSRPAFMHVNHPVKILNKFNDENGKPYTICGPCCTPLDVIGEQVGIPEPGIGDIVGVFNAGAYGYTMSMLHFISFDLPDEILVDNGKAIMLEH